MATLAQLRARVSAKIGLDTTASGADETLLDGWINDGVTDFLLATRCKVESGTTTLASGQRDFTVDTDILLIQSMVVVGQSQDYGMTQVTASDIDTARRGNSVVGYDTPFWYALRGLSLISVYPTPTATTTLTVYYVPRPVTLSSGANIPSEVPAEFHKAIEMFALAEAADYDDDQSSAQGQRYREEYDKWVAKARRSALMMGGSRLPKAYLNRRRGRYARREDVYP